MLRLSAVMLFTESSEPPFRMRGALFVCLEGWFPSHRIDIFRCAASGLERSKLNDIGTVPPGTPYGSISIVCAVSTASRIISSMRSCKWVSDLRIVERIGLVTGCLATKIVQQSS